MGRKGYLDLLAQKEKQIMVLETHIQTYTGRLSLLQSRLLATLDTLDVLQTNQAQELSASFRAQARLRDQLTEYVKIVKAAEAERDDMRDAVIKLIEKVETSKDYSAFSHSRIKLSSFCDPVPLTQRNHGRSKEEDELVPYAASLIEALRRERDIERKAHTQTLEQAEARILALEAKVSRREEELQEYIVNGERVPNSEQQEPRHTAELYPHPQHIDRGQAEVQPAPEQRTPRARSRVLFQGEGQGMASDQIAAVLDETVARNKRLESEITTLYRRLEHARAAKSTTASDRSLIVSSPTPTVEQTRLRQGDAYLSSHAPTTTLSHTSPIQFVSGRDALTMQDSPHVGDAEESFHDPDTDPNYEVLRGLEREIVRLGEKIDAFADERHDLLETISREHRRDTFDGGGNHEDNRPSDVNPPQLCNCDHALQQCLQCINDRCASLQASADALRNELAATRAAAQLREAALINAINELRAELFHGPPSSNTGEEETEPQDHRRLAERVPPVSDTNHPTPSTHMGDPIVGDDTGLRDHPVHMGAVYGREDGDETDDGEVSMELATPLMPLSTIPPSPSPPSHPPVVRTPSPVAVEGGVAWAPVSHPGDINDTTYDGLHAAHGQDDSRNGVPGDPEPSLAGREEGYADAPSIPLLASPAGDGDAGEVEPGVAEGFNDPADAEKRDVGTDEEDAQEEEGEEDEDEDEDALGDADSPTLSHVAMPLPALIDLDLHGHAHAYGHAHAPSPVMSLYHATSSFVAELRHVENEIALSQARLDEGVSALQRVEELVSELDDAPPPP